MPGEPMVPPFDRSGLSAVRAAALLAENGPNELPHTEQRSLGSITGDVLREPMLALLLIGGLAYLLLGDRMEAVILLMFATFSVIISIVQQARTERVLVALRDLSAPRALVVRDGERQRIAGRDVVTGDLLVVLQGDRVAADALLVEANELQIDEALLTGESVPVSKAVSLSGATTDTSRPGGDGHPWVFSGTLVVRGNGLAIVTATGARSEIGRIGASLATLEREAPRLRREITRIVLLCGIGGGGVALAVVLLYGLLRGGWLDAILAGIAVGMAMLPEEFPVVLTVFLAMGAWRIGRAGVLTRKAAAIETLGAASILCADKTGTLTQNRMQVVELWLPNGEATALAGAPLPEHFHTIIRTGARASDIDPIDPMEVAIHALQPPEPPPTSGDAVRLRHSYGLRPDLLAMANIWQLPRAADELEKDCLVAAKGAPEAIFDLCRLSAADSTIAHAAVEGMAARGIRVLGIAEAMTDGPDWPVTARGFDFRFVGLIGLADPLRDSVPAAVAQCRSAGIRVVMITGDHPSTAAAIAAQAGIADPDARNGPGGGVVTGADLAAMDDAELARRLPAVTVFARIMPEQKLRLVTAFKAAGEIVAMTGDGVNDAPALKAAHIGIAMGKRGTDVAREAAAIVLLDDDFGSIVTAIALGRRIHDNIRKAMGFIFAVHVPIAGLALLPLAAGLPLLFGPVHIALLEMIIDPVCALVFEAEPPDDDVMRRPPRPGDERLFSGRMIASSIAQGGVSFVLLGGLYLAATAAGLPEGAVRALSFFALVGAILVLVGVNRAASGALLPTRKRPNAALGRIVAAVTLFCLAAMLLPPVQAALRFEILRPVDLATAAGVCGLLMVLLKGLRRLAHKKAPDTAAELPPA